MDYFIEDEVILASFWKSERGFAFFVGERIEAFVLDGWSFAILSSLKSGSQDDISNVLLQHSETEAEHKQMLRNCEETLMNLHKLGLLRKNDC